MAGWQFWTVSSRRRRRAFAGIMRLLGQLMTGCLLEKASEGGKAAPASPNNPNGKRWWNDRRQQQENGQLCGICKHPAHSDGVCRYNTPRRAPEHGVTSTEAPYKAIQLYQRRCAELGIAPEQPGTADSNRVAQQT